MRKRIELSERSVDILTWSFWTVPGWFAALAALAIYPDARGHTLALVGVACVGAAMVCWFLSLLIWRLRMLTVLGLGAALIAFGVQLTVTGAGFWPSSADELEVQQEVGYALLCALIVLAAIALISFVAVAWVTLEIDDGPIQALAMVCVYVAFLAAACYTAAGSTGTARDIFIPALIVSLVLTAIVDPVSLIWS